MTRGDIYYIAASGNTVGSEQQAGRPGIIVSNDIGNKHSPVVEVIFLTTTPKKDLPTHVTIRTSEKLSTALCEQVTSVSVERLERYVGHVTDQELMLIDMALMTSLSLSPYQQKPEEKKMDELQVFSSDVIPVYTTDTGEKVVVGRELHAGLKINTAYKDWFPRMCEYGFTETEDFSSFLSESTGGRPSFNHLLKLDMAKHIAMIQRTPEGMAIREKLIALETNVSDLSPELRLLINMEVRQKQQTKALEATNARLDRIGDLIALNPNSWRQGCREIIVQIAQKFGGNDHIHEVQSEIYSQIDQRGKVSLKTRLTNRRQRMALSGASKAEMAKINKLDIIADDPKLVEIYLAVVKEMAIRYGVCGAGEVSP